MMDLAVCIVSYNSRGLLAKCLDSILASPPSASFRIIVVDNNSADDTAGMLKLKYPGVALIANGRNTGFAFANNQAIRSIDARYYLLLNSDTVVLPGAMDALVRFMDGHPAAGAAGARLLNKDGSLQRSCKTFFGLYIAFFIDTVLGRAFPAVERRHRLAGFAYDRNAEVDQPMGAALIVRKGTIDKVGLLDERFFFFFEEVDWCLRIKRAGWKIFFVHDAEIMHYRYKTTGEDEALRRLSLWHKGKYIFLEKYYPRPAVWLLRVFVVLSSMVFMVFKSSPEARRSYRALIKASL